MGVTYKWTLRKGGAKMACPQCGQKRFVPYVSVKDGATIATDEHGSAIYGKCDRQDHCGYNLYPSKVSDGEIKPVERKKEAPLRFYPSAVQTSTETNLFTYASRLIGFAPALYAWYLYKVGRDGKRTVFWQIAKDGTIRAGKSIPYLENGHRDKNDKYPAGWLHTCKAWDGYHEGKALEQCYFGEHLLATDKESKVVIVESEKTAVLMSAITSGWIWLASGGAGGIKNDEKNKALAGRDVWLMPDHGQYWSWRAIADKNGWQIFDEIELNPVFDGCDILDLVEAGAFNTKKI